MDKLLSAFNLCPVNPSRDCVYFLPEFLQHTVFFMMFFQNTIHVKSTKTMSRVALFALRLCSNSLQSIHSIDGKIIGLLSQWQQLFGREVLICPGKLMVPHLSGVVFGRLLYSHDSGQ